MQEALDMTKEEMDLAAHQLLQSEATPPQQQPQPTYPKPPPRQNRSDRL
jgi:hypothetical protein